MRHSLFAGWALARRVAVSSVFFLAAAVPSVHAALTASGLRCEYLTNPLGIDEVAPRLSWVVESPERGERQSAYQILVASSPELLAAGQGDLWDSGKVSSDATAQIVYGGEALTSRQGCYWKVRSWNQDGIVSAWSDAASWTIGLLQTSDWTAKWIDAMHFGPASSVGVATIVSAFYEGATAGSGSLDVTAKVKSLTASGDSLVSINTTTFGSDPAVRIVKQLRVVYQRDGLTLTQTFPENSRAVLPAALNASPANLVITSARYGTATINRDVRSTLTGLAASGPFSLAVNNTTLGPDPAPGQVKQLTIVYTVNGATGTVTLPEKQTLYYPGDLPVPLTPVVTSATYETVDGVAGVDVTGNLAARVQNGAYSVTVNNAALNGGVDIAYRHKKRLRVAFTINGISSVKIIDENKVFNFPADLSIPEAVPYLRKTFAVTKKVRRATVYATALGVYELHLNGKRVGDQWFAPGWTDFMKRLRYQTYDVTGLMHAGDNVLGAQLSGTWYSGHIGNNGYQFAGGYSRALLCQLEITYDDGSVDRIVSDASWKMHASPTLYSDLMEGEDYDARLEIAGWSQPGLDDSSWSSVVLRDEKARIMSSQAAEPVRELQELPAIALTEPLPGKWTFDLGQNMAGVARLKVSAPEGTMLTIRYAEALNPDGTIYTINLRDAPARDTYICKGGGEESWEPKFTYHGFRYVEVSGFPAKPELGAITGIVLGSDTPAVGQFTTSDPQVNQLQSNIWWGQRGNYFSIPTDCPQRSERLGWMGDAQTFIRTATYNADVAAFFTKWMADVNDAQVAGGAYPDLAPYNYWGVGTPGWGDAGVICPWMIYQMYGDTRILSKYYANMVSWVEWCKARSVGSIRSGDRGRDYGDWLNIGADTSKELIGTAFYAHSVDLLAKAAAVLGKTEDAATYSALFETIKAAFNNAYINPTTGVCTSPTQCAYALALRFNLLPDALRPKVAQLLEDDVIAKGNHLSIGFLGVAHLLPSLTSGGKTGSAYSLLQQDTFPSWLFSVKHGATTIWERWDGWTPEGGFQDPNMNSFNHYSLGSCGEWLFNTVGGIDIDPSAAGYRKIIIKPQPGGRLTSASASLATISGTVVSKWSVGNGGFALQVTIPANTIATVFIPTTDAGLVQESGRRAGDAPGVTFLRMDGGSAVYSVLSGRYDFKVKGDALPGADTITRDSLGQAKVSVADLLANDGVNVELISVDPLSVHGAAVSMNDGVIFYRPLKDYPGSDSFTYTISNAEGGIETRTVEVSAMSGPDTTLRSVGIDVLRDGGIRASFSGVPYRNYQVQYTADFTALNSWTNLSIVQGAADGSFEIVDPPPLPNARFYRAASP